MCYAHIHFVRVINLFKNVTPTLTKHACNFNIVTIFLLKFTMRNGNK